MGWRWAGVVVGVVGVVGVGGGKKAINYAFPP